jgi:AGZA family xanthine/uracil permease-like MFS transporter
MLGTLAGISITFISMRPAAQMWEAAWIALPVLALILIGFVSGVRLPGNVPMGLVALVGGSAIAWIGGYMDGGAVSKAAEDIAVGIPNFDFTRLANGLDGISPLLATAIPLGIYNFMEAMSNVESAAAAGDRYNLRAVLLADGTGAIVGAAMGSPFPPAVYIGHPGWKEAGGRISYSLATGIVIFALCVLGFFPLLGALLPIPAIVPVLLFIGLVIGAQAFRAVPKAYYPAVVIAMVPNVAAWGVGQIDNALAAAGTSAGAVGLDKLAGAGVIYGGLNALGQGAVLVGMMLAAIAVFIIDRRFVWAAAFCGFAGVLTLVGLTHSPKVHVFSGEKIALGYGFMALVCLGFAALKPPLRELDPADPEDLPGAAFEGADDDGAAVPAGNGQVVEPAVA